MKYKVFICYKRDSADDLALRLWEGLNERKITAFLDFKDIPTRFKGTDKWWDSRDQAIRDCETFLMILTTGFEYSPEIQKEIALAIEANRYFMCFRHVDFPDNMQIELLKKYMQTELLKKYINLKNVQHIEFATAGDLLRKACKNLYAPEQKMTEETPLPIRQPSPDEKRRFPLIHFEITQAVQNNPMLKRKLPNVGFNIRSGNDSPLMAKVEANVYLGGKDLGLVKGSRQAGKFLGYYDGSTLWSLNPYTIVFGNFSVPKICAETDEALRIEVRVNLIDMDGQQHKLLPVCWRFMRDKNDWLYEPSADC